MNTIIRNRSDAFASFLDTRFSFFCTAYAILIIYLYWTFPLFFYTMCALCGAASCACIIHTMQTVTIPEWKAARARRAVLKRRAQIRLVKPTVEAKPMRVRGPMFTRQDLREFHSLSIRGPVWIGGALFSVWGIISLCQWELFVPFS